jgi:hypothetical protein
MSTIIMPLRADEQELPSATFEPLVARGLADSLRSEADDDEDDDLFGDDDDSELDEEDADSEDDDDLEDEDLGAELDD